MKMTSLIKCMDFCPKPVLAFGCCHRLHLCLCVSVNHVEARITKFGPEIQNTLFKIPMVFGFIDHDLQCQIELKSKKLPHFVNLSLSS